MPDEKWTLIVRKATVYDLIRIFNEDPKRSYTVEELGQLLDAYIQGVEQ